MAKLESSLQHRYKALGQRAIVELLVKVLTVFESHSRGIQPQTEIFLTPENADLVPALVNALFDQLMPTQRSRMVEALVKNLELKQRVAFDCLDRLLNTQISRKDCQVEFLPYLPVFILPVI